MKLTIELVPKTSWYNNVRSEVSDAEWEAIRGAVIRRANHKCEICGSNGGEAPLECHEVWEYDDENHIQQLKRIIALCPDCHQVKHIGYASTQGKKQEATEHLTKVNGWTRTEAQRYIGKSFKQWYKRSQHEWTVDTSILDCEEYERFLKEHGVRTA